MATQVRRAGSSLPVGGGRTAVRRALSDRSGLPLEKLWACSAKTLVPGRKMPNFELRSVVSVVGSMPESAVVSCARGVPDTLARLTGVTSPFR
jgi:hypothetical protein